MLKNTLRILLHHNRRFPGGRFLALPMAFVAISVFLCGAGWRTFAPEEETLTITFTTSEAGGKFAPKHVHAVWIEDAAGNFVRTVDLWGNKRAHDIKDWYDATDDRQGDIDARTGATQKAHRAYTSVWDMKNRAGETVPDGDYQIKLFLADDNKEKNKFNRATYNFTKNGIAQTLTPAGQDGYSDIQIAYTGLAQKSPEIRFESVELVFPIIQVGESRDLVFDIQNWGEGDLGITSLTLAGNDKDVFELVSPPVTPFVVPGTTTTIALNAPPPPKETITVRFTPTEDRLYDDASVMIESNDPKELVSMVALRGNVEGLEGPPVIGATVDKGDGLAQLTWSNLNSTPSQVFGLAYDLYTERWAERSQQGSIWYAYPSVATTGDMNLAFSGAYFAWVSNYYQKLIPSGHDTFYSKNPSVFLLSSGAPHKPLALSASDTGEVERTLRLQWKTDRFGTFAYWISAYQINSKNWVQINGPQGSEIFWQFVAYGSDDFSNGSTELVVPESGPYLFFLTPMAWDAKTMGESESIYVLVP